MRALEQSSAVRARGSARSAQSGDEILPRRKKWLRGVGLGLLVLAIPLAIVESGLWWWDYGHAQEIDFVNRTVCTMRDKQLEHVRIFVRGVVAPHQDLAWRFPARVLLEGNSGKRVTFHVEVSYGDVALMEDVPAARLKTGDRLTTARTQRLFALAGWRATRAENGEDMAAEFLSVLQGAGVGPNAGGPVSGKYFKGRCFTTEWHARNSQ